ncbi:type IV secretion system protein [Glaciimonas sp. CA11.2]|uniref:type IV secretion system protein n=1 Tax=unclassified Glaciimonas TaxID=2644401 RepID=UPI002AB58D10|nr:MULTISPECIES: type IV secretion system protein [unclassified Glaciimonas]MDY7549201.1 type IV secretion system protein [Glaciimonas sp. CA11.2]MEB0013933.1 type IV secretion system protein [Glaciimonas sp. Cout2]MEB0083130.1 type IV secretion system protein [Glaciimonas sp. Gout2]MEB0161522.1 type IV secretion system protein [Glaciimonas sp. CA11.2]
MATINLQGMIGASDAYTNSFLTQIYPALANAISPALYSAAVLYWVLLGYKVYAGHAPFQARELLAKTIMTCAVFGTLSWGGFASVIYNVFVSFMDSAAGTIMAGKSSTSMLDALYVNANEISKTLRNSGWQSVGTILDGMLVLVLNTLLFVIALFYMTIAKFGLALTMVLLPLFIGFAMFSETRQWFMNWVSKMLNFALIYILVIAIVKFGFVAFGDFFQEVQNASSATEAKFISAEQINTLYVLELVLIIFMLQVKGWAAGLAGGASVQGASLLMMAVRTIKGGK